MKPSVAIFRSRRADAAKRTVRFRVVPRPPIAPAAAVASNQAAALIANARLTALNYHRLAAQAATPAHAEAMRRCAQRWEQRAAELLTARQGNLPPGDLFP